MAYTLGQVVSRVFDRSFGPKAQNQNAPARSGAVEAKPLKMPEQTPGVVLTLSAQAQKALSDLGSQAKPQPAPHAVMPRLTRFLDISI